MATYAYLWVALGGAAGAVARFAASQISPFTDPARDFPWITLGINLLGSFALGAIIGFWHGKTLEGIDWKLLLGTGFCGAFTTFSTLSLETVQLIEASRWGAVLGYWGLSLAMGTALGYAGWLVGRA